MKTFSLPLASSLIFQGIKYSSRDLIAYSEKVHACILEQGLSKPLKIAVCLDRSPELVAIALLCLQQKYTFIPVDIHAPPQRILALLRDCAPDLVITNTKYKELFKYETAFSVINLLGLRGPRTELLLETISNEIAYIMYTSGSSGTPKGVMVKRASLQNLVAYFRPRFRDYKVTIGYAPITFDFFISDTIIPLLCGMTVYLACTQEQHNPRLGLKLLGLAKPDVLQITPSRLQQYLLLDDQLLCFQHVKNFMIGGEQWDYSLLELLQSKTKANITNLYGPTEGCVWTTIADLTNSDVVHAGKPIDNVSIDIKPITDTDSEGVGEIVICGVNVAEGYLGKPQIENNFFCSDGINCYRTGDYGKILPSGNLVVLNRVDNQIKLRGYRIELEEIEICSLKIPGVKHACAGALSEKRQQLLYLAYTGNEGLDVTQELAKTLPSYMMPNFVLRLSQLPVNFNGKVDRKFVKELILSMLKEDIVQSNTYVDMKVLEIIKLHSANLSVSLSDKVTDLLVDSVGFIKIVLELEQTFDIEFEDNVLSKNAFETISGITDYINCRLSAKGRTKESDIRPT